MSPLRQRMLEDMQLRNLSAATQRSCIHYVSEYAKYYWINPEKLGLDDIRNYQLYLKEQRQLSPPSINTFVSAVQFLYTVTLDMPWSNTQFTRMKVSEKLPVVLSQSEVTQLLRHVGILKHRAVLMLCYGSGLRISEAVSLKVEHIDSARMLIRVEQGKGAKDRYTVLARPAHADLAAGIVETPAACRVPVSRLQARHSSAANNGSGNLPRRYLAGGHQ